MWPWLSPGAKPVVGVPRGWVMQPVILVTHWALGSPRNEQLRWSESCGHGTAVCWGGLRAVGVPSQKGLVHDFIHILDKKIAKPDPTFSFG